MKSISLYGRKFLLIFLIPLTVYCKKGDNAPAPSNLVLNVDISNNGSGIVNFTATATNADRYYFNFGKSSNEEAFRSTDGKATTTYPISGTFTVKVTAYSPNNGSVVVTKDINVVVSTSDEGYTTPESYPGMDLVWKDEFDGTQLNSAYWNFEIGNGIDGWGNNELQYYRQENTAVKDGYLTITAKKETFGGYQYTSSRITTQNKKSFQYGRIDIRAKLPKGQGIWPALWMLGANFAEKGWPYCGEIDIMELVGGGAGRDNTTHGTLHFDNNGNYASVTNSYTLPIGDFYDKFHVFSLVRDAETIKWYVDDIEFYSENISSPTMSELHESFFLLFNVAVGGRWPGGPDSTTSFPQQMIVDYVRAFQK